MSQTLLGYLADAVVGLHLAYVSYVVLGQAYIFLGMIRRWSSIRVRWFRISHLAMIWIVALEAVVGIACPLTTLENRLRRAAEQPHDERTFVGRCMDRVVFFVDYFPW